MTGRKLTPAKPPNKTAKLSHPKPLPEAAATAAPAPEKPRTIRSICEEGLLASLPYDQIIANVKTIHPTATTTVGCISWYRSKMVKRGLVPSGKELAAARKQAAEAAHSGEQ